MYFKQDLKKDGKLTVSLFKIRGEVEGLASHICKIVQS